MCKIIFNSHKKTASEIIKGLFLILFLLQLFKNSQVSAENNFVLKIIKYNPKNESFKVERKDTMILKGKIVSAENNEVVKNAKVIFFTLQKTFITYSFNNGLYILKIPKKFIKKKNVIRVSYTEIKDSKQGYKTENYILTKEELRNNYNIKANIDLVCLDCPTKPNKDKAIGYYNGISFDFENFFRNSKKRKLKRFFKNKEYYYFEQKFGNILLEKEIEDGLVLFIDKSK